MGRRNDYTTEEVERGLMALAFANGNASAASRTLADQETPIPKSTLQLWQRVHADRYAELRTVHVAQIHARLAQEYEDGARQALEAQMAAVGLASSILRVGGAPENVSAQDLKAANDAGTLARNLATVAGINGQHARPMRDMPAVSIEHRTPDQILKRLETLVPGLFVNGTAEEITEPELPPPHNGNGYGNGYLDPAA